MWSLLHDSFVGVFGRLDLARRKASQEYVDYRRGVRVTELKSDGRPLIWLHAVSLGEVNALAGLVAELRTQGKMAVAISTMTEAGLPAARKLNPEHAFIYPLDSSRFAAEIVERLQPKALVIIDGDFWFSMMRACKVARVPIVVVNGKLSEASARRHGWFPSYAREMFSGVAFASVQSETMANRFARFMPRERIAVDGNLKLDLPQRTTAPSRSRLGNDPAGSDPIVNLPGRDEEAAVTFVFGSIHPSELEHIVDPITRVIADRPAARVVVIPRHPDKFTADAAAQYFAGIDASRFVWINQLGVLREYYATADAAFVGGTFCEVGGHNLAEPALAGVPVLYGPDVHTQLPLHELITQYGAGKQVATANDLYAAMLWLIDDAELRARMSAGANRLRDDSQGLSAKIAGKILATAGIV